MASGQSAGFAPFFDGRELGIRLCAHLLPGERQESGLLAQERYSFQSVGWTATPLIPVSWAW